MCHQNIPSSAPLPSEAPKLILWPDGTWCWQDDFRSGDYTHMSDDYEVIDMADMPRVERLARENASLAEEIQESLA